MINLVPGAVDDDCFFFSNKIERLSFYRTLHSFVIYFIVSGLSCGQGLKTFSYKPNLEKIAIVGMVCPFSLQTQSV